jgi:hypothetical protein
LGSEFFDDRDILFKAFDFDVLFEHFDESLEDELLEDLIVD